MAKYLVAVEKTYNWQFEVDAETKEEATEKVLTNEDFDEATAQKGYCEVVDIEEIIT